jgi:hypothetical protein
MNGSAAPAHSASASHQLGRLGQPFPRWFLPFWIAFVAFLWWDLIHRQLTIHLPAEIAVRLGPSIVVPVAMGLVARFLGNAIEAGLYLWWWRHFRIGRIPYWGLVNWLVTFSVFDLLAEHLRLAATAGSAAAPPWIVPLVGVGVLRPGWPASGVGFWAAFGGIGALTIARVAATASIQARAIGRSLPGPLALTTAFWLLTRFVIWWGTDLMRGRSLLP